MNLGSPAKKTLEIIHHDDSKPTEYTCVLEHELGSRHCLEGEASVVAGPSLSCCLTSFHTVQFCEAF